MGRMGRRRLSQSVSCRLGRQGKAGRTQQCGELGSTTGSTPTLEGIGRYSEMSLQPAILDLLSRENGAGLRVPEIRDRLLGDGLQTKAKSFLSTLHSVCRRLETQGRITGHRVRGKKLYKKTGDMVTK